MRWPLLSRLGRQLRPGRRLRAGPPAEPRAGSSGGGGTPAGAAGPASARANGRVRDVPNERLVRWYVTVGLVDPPLSRRGRVARYGRRHLLQLVAVKRRQAEGRSLAEIQAELAGATDEALAAVARVPDTPPPARTGRPPGGPSPFLDTLGRAAGPGRRGRARGAESGRGGVRGRRGPGASRRSPGSGIWPPRQGREEPCPPRTAIRWIAGGAGSCTGSGSRRG